MHIWKFHHPIVETHVSSLLWQHENIQRVIINQETDDMSLGCVSIQLCARVSNKISSAWTFPWHVYGNTGFGRWFWLFGLVFRFDWFRVKSIWTENRDWTGLWSENLDSPLVYQICFIPSPFHNIRSHLKQMSMNNKVKAT